MKRIITPLFVLLLVAAIGGAFFYLYKSSKAKPVVWQTEGAEMTDVVKKTVATGSIVPRRSVEVKPKVTGVLSELYVEPGKLVKQGDALGKITIIPDASAVNNAEAQVRLAQIAFDNAKRELDRNEALFKQGIVAEADLMKFRMDFDTQKQQLELGNSSLQLVREGATRSAGKGSTLVVTATVPGTVIDVPVKVGFSVIQANSFNPGTTVATIADMDDMIFDGNVDESEVAKIKEGMPLQIKIGAIEKDKFDGKLEYIAPQGKTLDGAIQFEVKAAITQKPGIYIRAGYSANADIVLDQKPHVLAIREALVQYDTTVGSDGKPGTGKPYVEVETAPQTFVRKDVQLGLSDGIKVEILGGVTLADKIKIPDNAGPASGSGSASKPPPPPK
jgi:HlyD family secretion protein